MDLDSPIMRFAGATGEDPEDVQAAIQTLRVDGWSFDRIWKLLEASIDSGEKVVDVAARALSERDSTHSTRPTPSEKFQRHRRKRNKRQRRKRGT